jgi:hypothetical protein
MQNYVVEGPVEMLEILANNNGIIPLHKDNREFKGGGGALALNQKSSKSVRRGCGDRSGRAVPPKSFIICTYGGDNIVDESREIRHHVSAVKG